MTQSDTVRPATRSIAHWKLWVPLLLQTGLILAIPAQAIYTHLTGKTVILQTVPVDPYDLLRGYSVTLNYDISNTNALQKLPGWNDLPKQGSRNTLAPQQPIYVVLQAPAATESRLPKPWKPVRVSRDRPTNLSANQIALKGEASYNWVQYGVETYYIPEDQREQINNDLNQAPRRQPPTPTQAAVVEVKVDAQGRAVPVSIWVNTQGTRPEGVRHYRF